MIKKPNAWDEVSVFEDRPKLPAGAYICKIKKAVQQSNPYGNQLCVLFDISDGEFKDYYSNEFKTNLAEDKKYKGVLKVWLPTDDGSDKDKTTISKLKGFIKSVEDSNVGFSWDWNEDSLKGRSIGILMRNEEWEFNGKSGWTVRPFIALSTGRVEAGNYTIPADKALANKTADVPVAPAEVFSQTDNSDGELPF